MSGGRRRPWPLLLLAAVGLAFLVLPVIALLIRTPWRASPRILSSGDVVTALRLSLETATLATVLAVGLGVPLAWCLVRLDIKGRSFLRALTAVPLVLPPVAGGIALIEAYGRKGVIGQWLLRAAGVSLPFTTPAVVVAEAFVAMPFLVLAVEGAMRGVDVRFEQAASTLGASSLFTFRHVTLPALLPGIVSGAVLCWARALGEFGATITFAGNYPGTTQTMPVAIYLRLQDDPNAAIVLSLVLLAVSIAVLAALRDRWLTA